MRSRSSRLLGLAAAAALLGATEGRAAFVTFETGQVRPLALSPSQTRLFAVNTPDNRLEIFDVNVGDGSLTHAASVPVGLEPIAVAALSDTEVWVVNHLSDSVSIVDAGATPPRVTRTLLVGDEPRDIVFAGPLGDPRAFITTAHRGQNTPFHPTIETILTTPGIGRADVWVFEADDLGASLEGTPLAIVTLFGDTPRALAASPDGSTVYAAVFHSGNQTTPLSEGVVCNGGVGAAPCTSLAGEMTFPGGLPAPNTNCTGQPQPEVGLIVKFNGVTGEWEDELGRNWSNAVRFDLPDEDVFAIDADAPVPTQTGLPWTGVGTIIFNMVVDPANPSRVYVSNTDAQNHVRFEGDGLCSTTVQGHLHEARITVLNGANVEPHHLNNHIDYDTTPAPPGVKDASLSIPTALAVSGSELYVTAFGSGKVGVFDTTELVNGTFVPSPASHIQVSGGGPSGLAVRANRLYVFTRFDNGISVVDTGTKQEIAHHPLHSPEPAHVKLGRRFLYDARTTTSNGESPCAACHVFGDFDSLSWDLGNPDDLLQTNFNPIEFTIPSANKDFRALKGPMSTQSLRGMANHGPMHWRGDRSGGEFPGDPNALDEDLAFKKFNVAFHGLLGREGPLTDVQMDAFTDFILEVTYPPNPIRNLDNSLTPAQQNGRDFYFGLLPPDPESDSVRTCNGCHVLNPALGFFGGDGDTSFENETQLVKIPHLRNMYQKVGMFGMPNIAFVSPDPAGNPSPHTGDQVRGVGFLHDGSFDTLFRFHRATVFNQSLINPGGFPIDPMTGDPTPGDPLRRDMERFMLAFDSNLAPIVGQQTTLTSTNAGTVGGRIDLIIARAAASECDVVVKGTLAGEQRGWYRLGGGTFQSDRAAETPLTDVALRAVASTPGQDLTYTCVPPGSGERIGVDRDDDGIYDGDEADAGTDPANPLSFPGPATAVQGKRLVMRDPRPNIDERRRRFVLLAKATGAPALSGNPTVDGATLTITLSGALATQQAFSLPAGSWAPLGTSGFRYSDPGGANGPVKTVILKRTGTGRMTFKVVGRGANGQIDLAPPNAGTSAEAILVTGTARYCTTIGGAAGGTVTNNTETLFKVRNPTASVACP
jgi:6-phosphogluconolactonase (cycloisomerase 2 family)